MSSTVSYRTKKQNGGTRCRSSFSIALLVWTGKFDLNTLGVDGKIFESRGKKLRIERYRYTYGRGLNLIFHCTYLLVVKATLLGQNNNTTNLCACSDSVCQQAYTSLTLFRRIPSDNNIMITHSPFIVHRRFKLILSYSFVSADCCGACDNVANSRKICPTIVSFLLQRNLWSLCESLEMISKICKSFLVHL